ncbi:hypothetical protein SBA4_1930009 [Candidatus Sulfopaludibacter sp. SbA4]|nr:hypothetical protein SBA4_1930009 [Candidatus Sulfopaludibacter sp. SbA4]
MIQSGIFQQPANARHVSKSAVVYSPGLTREKFGLNRFPIDRHMVTEARAWLCAESSKNARLPS